MQSKNQDIKRIETCNALMSIVIVATVFYDIFAAMCSCMWRLADQDLSNAVILKANYFASSEVCDTIFSEGFLIGLHCFLGVVLLIISLNKKTETTDSKTKNSSEDSISRQETADNIVSKEVKTKPKKELPINVPMMFLGFLAYGIITTIVAFIGAFLLTLILAIISLGGLLFDIYALAPKLEIAAVVIGGIGAVIGGFTGATTEGDEIGDLFGGKKK